MREYKGTDDTLFTDLSVTLVRNKLEGLKKLGNLVSSSFWALLLSLIIFLHVQDGREIHAAEQCATAETLKQVSFSGEVKLIQFQS